MAEVRRKTGGKKVKIHVGFATRKSPLRATLVTPSKDYAGYSQTPYFRSRGTLHRKPGYRDLVAKIMAGIDLPERKPGYAVVMPLPGELSDAASRAGAIVKDGKIIGGRGIIRTFLTYVMTELKKTYEANKDKSVDEIEKALQDKATELRSKILDWAGKATLEPIKKE